MNTESTVKEFDMTDFGFDVYKPRIGGNKVSSSKDYIINARNKSSKYEFTPIISLSEESTKYVRDMLGDYVDVGINSVGHICLQRGTNSKVSTKSEKAKRGVISVASMRDRLIEHYGPFKRLYFEAQPYGKFNAVILKPTGERDK